MPESQPPMSSPQPDSRAPLRDRREPAGADVILLNRRGEVLLVLRDDRPDIPCPNTWALLGGYIEPGESPEQALLRELREEIGVELGGAEPFRAYYWPECTEHIFWQWLDIDPQATPLTEGQRLAYFPREQLASLAFASHYGEVLEAFFASDACPLLPRTDPEGEQAGAGAEPQDRPSHRSRL
jgi:8-oxo-dGTP diphosphatase